MRTRPVDIQKDILAPVVLAFFVFFVGIVASVATYSFARNHETSYFPIIKDFKMTDIRVFGNRLRFRPYFNKVRDCQLLDQAWYVTLPDNTLRQVYVGFPNQTEGDQSAPLGVQLRTDFEVGQGEWPEAVSQHGFMYHDCLGYKVRTKVGPFPIIK